MVFHSRLGSSCCTDTGALHHPSGENSMSPEASGPCSERSSLFAPAAVCSGLKQKPHAFSPRAWREKVLGANANSGNNPHRLVGIKHLQESSTTNL